MKSADKPSVLPSGISYVSLALIMVTMLFSCKKETAKNERSGPIKNIYLAGWRSYYPSNEVAVYWKNGVMTDLTDGSAYITANSIVASGSDVYVGGNQYNGHSIAVYWKNGVMATLSDPSKDSYVSSAAISGSDVYFAGYENDGNRNIAKYWKNGHGVNLTSGSYDARLLAIAISGNNVYAAGWESNGTVEVAKFWKNGTPLSLSDGSNNTEAGGIAVSGNDVYVLLTAYIQTDTCLMCARAGAATPVSMIWKNGSIIETTGQNQAFSALAVSNQELYVAAGFGNAMGYFKDGVAVPFTSGPIEGQVSEIAIGGADVYVSGYENISGHNVPVCWKNGTPQLLTDGTNNAYATGIYLGN